MRKIYIEALSIGSIFKLAFVGTTLGMIPFVWLCGILSFFGVPAISLNGVAKTGGEGLFVAIIMPPIIGFTAASFAAVFVPFGWWLYRRGKRRTLSAYVREPDQSD